MDTHILGHMEHGMSTQIIKHFYTTSCNSTLFYFLTLKLIYLHYVNHTIFVTLFCRKYSKKAKLNTITLKANYTFYLTYVHHTHIYPIICFLNLQFMVHGLFTLSFVECSNTFLSWFSHSYKLQEQVDLHTQGQEFKQSIQIIVLNQIHDPFSLKGVQNSKL